MYIDIFKLSIYCLIAMMVIFGKYGIYNFTVSLLKFVIIEYRRYKRINRYKFHSVNWIVKG